MEIALRLVEPEAGEKRQGVQIGLKSSYTGSPINPAPGGLCVSRLILESYLNG